MPHWWEEGFNPFGPPIPPREPQPPEDEPKRPREFDPTERKFWDVLLDSLSPDELSSLGEAVDEAREELGLVGELNNSYRDEIEREEG